jgi:hypothetical protein
MTRTVVGQFAGSLVATGVKPICGFVDDSC